MKVFLQTYLMTKYFFREATCLLVCAWQLKSNVTISAAAISPEYKK